MWNWGHLGIFFALSLLVCLCGFKKYVYFMSIGYGFSVAIIGAAMAVLGLTGAYGSLTIAHYIQFALFIIYGFRLSGFLLIREIKNASYRKTLAEATGDESKMPIFVKFFMWIFMGVLYVAQTSGVAFRLFNGAEGTVCQWIGIAISAFGIILEAIADQQKSAQKAERPDMVAMKQLYKIVRCPNYFGEPVLDRCYRFRTGYPAGRRSVEHCHHRLHSDRVYYVQRCPASGEAADGPLRQQCRVQSLCRQDPHHHSPSAGLSPEQAVIHKRAISRMALF